METVRMGVSVDPSLARVFHELEQAAARYPELAGSITEFVFEDCAVRVGMIAFETVADAGRVQVRARPSAPLIHFARAVSHGFVPGIAIPATEVA